MKNEIDEIPYKITSKNNPDVVEGCIKVKSQERNTTWKSHNTSIGQLKKEKELLIKVFQKIEENIQQYSVEKLSRYSNAMSGIGLSSLIEEWIVQNELTEKIYTETELLSVIAELYLQICGDFRYQEHIQSICKKWIDGQTPMVINNKETIRIAEVESLCNKRISYEMIFLIGNICDLIEVDGENEEQVDQRNILTLLQKKVKYGVPNMTAISICESI